MTEYERGFRAGIEAAATEAEDLGVSQGGFIAGRIRALAPPADHSVGAAKMVEAEPGRDEAVEPILDDLMRASPDKVAQAKARPILRGWFVGQVLKRTGGQGNAKDIRDLLDAKLDGPSAHDGVLRAVVEALEAERSLRRINSLAPAITDHERERRAAGADAVDAKTEAARAAAKAARLPGAGGE